MWMSIQEMRNPPVTYKDYGGTYFLWWLVGADSPSTMKHPPSLVNFSVCCNASDTVQINNRREQNSPGSAVGRAAMPIRINAISVMQDLTRCMVCGTASETSQNAEEEVSRAALYTC
jgi:hypothetical protein